MKSPCLFSGGVRQAALARQKNPRWHSILRHPAQQVRCRDCGRTDKFAENIIASAFWAVAARSMKSTSHIKGRRVRPFFYPSVELFPRKIIIKLQLSILQFWMQRFRWGDWMPFEARLYLLIGSRSELQELHAAMAGWEV